MIDLVPYDTHYDPAQALTGMKKLINEDGVKLVLMIGGNDLSAEVRKLVNRHRMLVTTLLPSDLSPDTPSIIAPSEVHPIYNVTGVDWLSRTAPHLKTSGHVRAGRFARAPLARHLSSSLRGGGNGPRAEHLFPVDTIDFAPIVAKLLAPNPDILCWDTAYEPFVHALTREAHRQGFKGRLLSCTCDNYAQLIRRTSVEFMEGFVFQFPDFDDPKLQDSQINFENAHDFYREFCDRYPNSWSAVSWEYASTLELWRMAVQRARTFEPFSVLSMMKFGGVGHHAFGEAVWWGRDLFGIDNALVGDWPVVMIEKGRARIQEFTSTIDWLKKHNDVLVRHMRAMNLMWDQRVEQATVGD